MCRTTQHCLLNILRNKELQENLHVIFLELYHLMGNTWPPLKKYPTFADILTRSLNSLNFTEIRKVLEICIESILLEPKAFPFHSQLKCQVCNWEKLLATLFQVSRYNSSALGRTSVLMDFPLLFLVFSWLLSPWGCTATTCFQATQKAQIFWVDQVLSLHFSTNFPSYTTIPLAPLKTSVMRDCLI